jgi:lambda repressor-like predicted transcriptional regulator
VDLRTRLSSLEAHVRDVLNSVAASPGSPPRRTQVRSLQRQQRLAEDDVERLLVDYASGLSTRALSIKYQVNRETVGLILKRQGVDTRPHVRKLSDHDVARAARMYEAGASLATVGKAVGVNAATLRGEFAKAGLPVRARRGWQPNT